MCMGAIYWARPLMVYYGNSREDAAAIGFDDSFIYEELKSSIPERLIEMINLGGADALKVFEEWSSKNNKISY